MKAVKAIKEGKFKEEIIPVKVTRTKVVGDELIKTEEIVDIDDGPRADTTLEKMAKLKSPFRLADLLLQEIRPDDRWRSTLHGCV